MKIEQIVSQISRHFPNATYSAKEALLDLNSARATYLAALDTPESALGWQRLESIKLQQRTELSYGVEYCAQLPSEVLTWGGRYNKLIRYVGPADWSGSFTKSAYPDIKYKKYSKRIDNKYSCYYLQGISNLFVVFYNEPELTQVSVEAVFADPTSVGEFNLEKDDYPMRDLELLSVIIPQIVGQKKALGW